MKYDLKRPCPKCPFRTDCLESWLGQARATEIAQAITLHQQTFACHETTEVGGAAAGKEQHCAGALIMLENEGHAPPQNVRVAERLGISDPDRLDLEAPVFPSTFEFIAHHMTDRDRDQHGEPCQVTERGCEAPAGYATPYGGAVAAEPVSAGATVECVGCGSFVCENCSTTDADGRWCPSCKEFVDEDEDE